MLQITILSEKDSTRRQKKTLLSFLTLRLNRDKNYHYQRSTSSSKDEDETQNPNGFLSISNNSPFQEKKKGQNNPPSSVNGQQIWDPHVWFPDVDRV
ncbi:hypothetical protein JTE90_006494 [Oedothorax gibbosus]|uniref:Proopiomelanocortin A n=1 Tax=Oedothorax gibbosus TaxID=931172 RepID=A0AAV6VMM4_9ARAC|nr:hypothetical protein JTE90_006494 [Oedothorax gibbosus]